jgi:hypothetical protein
VGRTSGGGRNRVADTLTRVLTFRA